MDHWKKNSSLRYFAGLALLMLLAGFAISASPAFARYRSGETRYLHFEVREPEQICFVEEDGNGNYSVLDKSPVPEISENGEASMTLTVANGSSRTRYSQSDQKVSVRLISSLGIGGETPEIKIKDQTGKEITATAKRIEEGSEYYSSDGEGWVFTFEENEAEYYWILEGGRLSYITVTITVDASDITDMAVLQPTAVAEVIK